MSRWIVEDAQGSRRPAPEEFPLSIGGSGAGIELPDHEGTGVAAWLGLSGEDLFLQSGDAGLPVTCNGLPVSASHWLQAGDVLRIGSSRLQVTAVADGLRLSVDRIETREDHGDPVVIVATAPEVGAPERTIQPVEFQPRTTARPPRRKRRFRVLPLLLLVLAIDLVVVAWYGLDLTRVEIQVDPTPDRLAVKGGFPGVPIAGRYLLRPGSYRLHAEKEGYRPLERSLEVTGEGGQTFAFSMYRNPGWVFVEVTGPEDGAPIEVLVDDAVRPGTPPEPLELEAGEYEIRIRADRHQEVMNRVTVTGSGDSQTLTAELSPLWSAIRFESRPPGASVVVDGQAVGATPVTARLMPGTHRLEFRLAGHGTVRESIRVSANEPQAWPSVTLHRLQGKLVLGSRPEGATVRVDGEYRGQTPLEIPLAPGVEHEVELTRSGHSPASRTVRLEAGETQEWTPELGVREGEIRLRVRPEGAELLVDGETRGTAAGTLVLPAVPHRIEIRMEGHKPFRATVTPRPGFPESLEVELELLNPDIAATAPRQIESPGGQTLFLIEGGRFRMGASRREPGRRANEALRDVELTRPFYLSEKEVTNQEFGKFRAEHQSGQVGGYNLEIGHHPVVRVSWEDAALYCNWLSRQASLPEAYVEVNGRLVARKPLNQGYRLPLEAEWAWAARFPHGGTPRKYPWGDTLPVAPGSGNYADASATGLVAQVLAGYDDGHPATAPAGAFPPDPAGLYDLGGNVSEWMHDVYSIYASTSGTAVVDPTGAEEGELHSIRGSSWMHSTVSQLRLTYRDYGKKPRPDVGFRVARYVK